MTQNLIFGNVKFNEKQTKAIGEMIEGWKTIGKKELLEELIQEYIKQELLVSQWLDKKLEDL